MNTGFFKSTHEKIELKSSDRTGPEALPEAKHSDFEHMRKSDPQKGQKTAKADEYKQKQYRYITTQCRPIR